jgi:hypothetical protein
METGFSDHDLNGLFRASIASVAGVSAASSSSRRQRLAGAPASDPAKSAPKDLLLGGDSEYPDIVVQQRWNRGGPSRALVRRRRYVDTTIETL